MLPPAEVLTSSIYFQEGQSAPQKPQTLFDADFEGLASNAEVLRCIFLIKMIVRNRLELILAMSWFT